MKVVLKLDLHEDKVKQKAMKTVSGIHGFGSAAMEMKDKKLTVTGDVDPIRIVCKLRKLCHADIVSIEIGSVGPAKEPEKKKDVINICRYMQILIPSQQQLSDFLSNVFDFIVSDCI